MTRHFLFAAALCASVAFATGAEAAGYAGNACVGKKQSALGKYTRSVAKAWAKNPSDATARNEAIAKAFTKLEGAWTKEEEKAVKKNATCDESTDTVANSAAIVDAAIAGISGENFDAAARYIDKAMKAWGKYIKDPVKDPGKGKLTTALGKASTSYLAGENMAVNSAAAALESSLVEATTTAPNYPSAFQMIEPGSEVIYKKQTLQPKCIDGDEYVFFARKGTSNNVLMYYQGGGACWDKTSCYTVPGGTCKRTTGPGDNPDLTDVGFADYDNPANPFADWSVVFVGYCSCDVHWGDAQATYPNPGGGTVQHRGRVNAAVAEKFAREHFLDPENVFVTGSSAGSYGAIMNSYWLMKEVWPNAQFSVLGDGGVGVITQGFLDTKIGVWGLDQNFPKDLPGVSLPVTNLSLTDLIDGLAQKWPTNRFGNYDTSFDGGSGSQLNFFQVMRYPAPPGSFITDWPSWWEPACEWNACMRAFKEENSTRAANYKYFTAAGSRHTVFGSDKVYTETKSTKEDGTPMTVAAWVQAMIDGSGDWVNVDCNHMGGDCSLTNTCQGGTNAGGFCSKKCSSGINAGLDCVNSSFCGATCLGGSNNGNPCENNADCPGLGATCADACVTSNVDCPGGSCQLDPDTANAPFNNDDTVNCPMTDCPCGLSAAVCAGGTNDGNACTTNAQCSGGSCVWVRCPTFTAP